MTIDLIKRGQYTKTTVKGNSSKRFPRQSTLLHFKYILNRHNKTVKNQTRFNKNKNFALRIELIYDF